MPVGANSSTIVNAGTITALNNTAIQGSDPGIDSVTNVGLIVGDLALFGGNDTYDGRGGIISGNVFMGDGNDIVFGGDGVEIVFGGVGDDTIHLGGGDDTFKADGGGDGDDFINGGDGIDTYDATLAAFGITVDLNEGLALSLTPGSGIGNDHLDNIENVIGSAFADSLTGDAFANVLKGLAGIDKLVGAGGNDTLDGGDGADILTGGAGRDLLYGGGADGQIDTFDFNKVTESGITGATRDHILDFEDGFDKIDLSTIDAVVGKSGNQAFKFVAGAFTKAGQVHAFVNDAGNTVIEVNTDHDKGAEMSIVLIGNFALTGADFVL
jgi:serralysin